MMDKGRYIWCRNCGAIHHVSPFDRSPMYQVSEREVQEIPVDDWRNFMDRHAGHRLEPLESTGNIIFPRGSAYDPMNVGYIHVTNGKESILLRRSRRGIEQPLVYEIADGRLLEAETRVEIDSSAIRKEMQRHFSCGPSMPLSDEEINLFIAIFGDVIQSLDAEALSTGEYSDSDDQTNYCELPLSVIDELIEKCGGFYSPSQLAALRQFAEGHRGASDVMALIKRSAIVFSPNA